MIDLNLLGNQRSTYLLCLFFLIISTQPIFPTDIVDLNDITIPNNGTADICADEIYTHEKVTVEEGGTLQLRARQTTLYPGFSAHKGSEVGVVVDEQCEKEIDIDNIKMSDPRMEAHCHNFAEGGARYDFYILGGKVHFWKDREYKGEFSFSPIQDRAIFTSYSENRKGEEKPVPLFDMIAADNNRIIAKVKGENRFFWAQMEFEYPKDYYDPLLDVYPNINGYYAKVDPNENPENPDDHPEIDANPHNHFGTTNFRNTKKIEFEAAEFGTITFKSSMPDLEEVCTNTSMDLLSDVMQVKVYKGHWYEIDGTPPRNTMSGNVEDLENTFREKKKKILPHAFDDIKVIMDKVFDKDESTIKNTLKEIALQQLHDFKSSLKWWQIFKKMAVKKCINAVPDIINNIDLDKISIAMFRYLKGIVIEAQNNGYNGGNAYAKLTDDFANEILDAVGDFSDAGKCIANGITNIVVNILVDYDPDKPEDLDYWVKMYMDGFHRWERYFSFPSDMFKMENFQPYKYENNNTKTRITIKDVIDIGVGNPHRYEHCRRHLGGEVQNFFKEYKLENMQTTVLSDGTFHGEIVDGNGFNDGTCNFFILAKIEMDVSGNDDKNYEDVFAVLWLDEQEYFSERWRVVHPRDAAFEGAAGTCLNMYPVLAWEDNVDMEDYEKKYWHPYDILNENTRMATSRYAIVLADDEQIYTKSFFWAVTDNTWRWRNYPSIDRGLGESIDKKSIQIRDDMTIYMRGARLVSGQLQDGYWYQRLLNPYNEFKGTPKTGQKRGLKPDKGYDHPWLFMATKAFAVADKNYYRMGMYKDSEEQDHYAYKGYNPRTHVYKINSLSYAGGEQLKPETDYSKINNKVFEVYDYVNGSEKEVYHPMYAPMDEIYKNPIHVKVKWVKISDGPDELYAIFDHCKNDDIGIFKLDNVRYPFRWKEIDGNITLQINNKTNDLIDLNNWSDCEVKHIDFSYNEGVLCEFDNPIDVHSENVPINKGNKYRFKNINIGAIENGSAAIVYTMDITYSQSMSIQTSIHLKDEQTNFAIWDQLVNTYFTDEGRIKYGTQVWVEDVFGNSNVFTHVNVTTHTGITYSGSYH